MWILLMLVLLDGHTSSYRLEQYADAKSCTNELTRIQREMRAEYPDDRSFAFTCCMADDLQICAPVEDEL